MFWIAIAVFAAGASLTKMGAMSVQIAVQAVALKVALAVLVLIALWLLWRWYQSAKTGGKL